MLPAGTYAAVVAPAETDHGRASIQWGPATQRSPFSAAVGFEVINGPESGQKITAFLYFGDASFQRSLESLRACGFTGDDIDKFADQTPDIECQIVVEHETYEGKVRPKVKWINKAGGVFTFEKPLPQSDLLRFSAQFKTALKSVPVVQGKKAERQAPTAAPPPAEDGWRGNDDPDPPPPSTTDDIPF